MKEGRSYAIHRFRCLVKIYFVIPYLFELLIVLEIKVKIKYIGLHDLAIQEYVTFTHYVVGNISRWHYRWMVWVCATSQQNLAYGAPCKLKISVAIT